MIYRREIDGLRAVAVVPVILFHAGMTVFSGGYVGVDVFFVISGYLITNILIGELEQGNFSIARFYERRARRILPALFFVVMCCIPFAWMWMLPSELKDFSQSLVAVTVFASNILFWREEGYFAPAAELKPLLHTWSLAVEEQYYLLFPVFLLLAWRFGRDRVFWAIVSMTLVSLLLSEWGWRNEPGANFYLAPTRAWELLIGSICAFWPPGREQSKNDWWSLLGLAMIVLAIFYYDEATPFPSVYALVPVLGTALIIVFGGTGTWTAQLLGTQAFVGIGLISYSAYLWHQPLFAFARIRSLTEPAQSLMLTLAVLSLILAYFSWRFIEKPFRKGQASILPTRRAVFALSGAVGAAIAVAGLVGHFGNGFDERLNLAQRKIYSTVIPSPMREKCHFDPRDSLAKFIPCEYFGESADTAIYGNSHAVELAYGIAEMLKKKSRSIAHFSISGCAPGFRTEVDQYCDDFYQKNLRSIIQENEIKYVILAYRAENSGQVGAKSIVELANYLSSRDKKVLLVLQAPTLPRNISFYLKQSFLSHKANIISRDRSEWRNINRALYDALSGLNPKIKVIDSSDYFCDTQKCYAIKDNNALYFDDNHMSIPGARIISEDIVSHLN